MRWRASHADGSQYLLGPGEDAHHHEDERPAVAGAVVIVEE